MTTEITVEHERREVKFNNEDECQIKIHNEDKSVPSSPRSFTELEKNCDVIERDTCNDSSKDECAICLCELYEYGDNNSDEEASIEVCILPCSHKFHSECMIKLRSSHSAKRCPLCRADLPVDPEEQNEEAGVKFHELDAQVVSGEVSWTDAHIAAELKQVITLWRESALSGNAKAQCNLGLMYKRGRGVVQSDEDSLYWYRLSANQGNSNAMYNMGMMYEKGICVEANLRIAVSWYLTAASDGQPRAEYALGSLFERGWLDEFNEEFFSLR